MKATTTTRSPVRKKNPQIEKSETLSSTNYFEPNTNFYDPFSYQSTETRAILEQYTTRRPFKKNSIYSNRLDSRFSVQVSDLLFRVIIRSKLKIPIQ